MPLRVTTIRTISNLESTWSPPSRISNRILARRCTLCLFRSPGSVAHGGIEPMPALVRNHAGMLNVPTALSSYGKQMLLHV